MLQVVHHNVELVQHFGGAVVDSVQHAADGSSQTGGMVPAMAGAAAGGASSPAGVAGGNTHSSVNHSAAGLKQRAPARAQADGGVQMTQLNRGDADE